VARPCLITLLSLAAPLVALSPGCSAGSKKAELGTVDLGRRIAAGEVRAMLPSADGAWLAWLDGCRVARGQYLPPGTANCDLRVAPSVGGDATKVAGAVTTLPQGLTWTRAGASLAALADYDYAGGSGSLVLWRDGRGQTLAEGVTFSGFGPGGELGFVAEGKLSVLSPGAEEPRAIEGAEGVASFEFAPAGAAACAGDRVQLLARRARASGGQLLAIGCRLDKARPLAARVAEYGFAPDGDLLAYTVEAKEGPELRLARASVGSSGSVVGRGVQRFAFASVGGAIAFVGDAGPGKQGSLYLAERGRPAARVAREVGDFRWAAKAARVAWLERYDPRVRAGVLGVGAPGAAPRTFGRNVTDFDVAADGRAVAFLQHTTRGGYSVDLFLARLEGATEPPQPVAQGVFGFSFSPDGAWLYYRTRCTRNGEGCDLERVPATGLAKDARPEQLAQGLKSFEFDPRDPSRLLLGWQRADRAALDVAVWDGGKAHRVGRTVLPGSARFLGPDSRRVGYAVTDPARAGVYVAEPAPAAR